ncbi:MAG: hypothetical protein MJ209_04920 [archaeon]|nr:hypothetical protein [archaeon]
MKSFKNILNLFKNILKGKEINNDKISFICPIISNTEDVDVNEINNILMKLKHENLIEKYNKNLIKNIFNLKDIYTTD